MITDGDKIVGYIYETKDYEKFKHVIGNRSDAIRRAKKVLPSLQKHGYISGLPVMIDSAGGIWEGQARVEASKELNIPFCYTVVDELKDDTFIDINISQTGWRLLDYIEGYSEQGNSNYTLLVQLLQEFPGFKAAEIYGIVENRIIINGYSANPIKEGYFVLPDGKYPNIKKTLQYLDSFLPAIKEIYGQQRAIRTGIAWIINNTNCDKKRLRELIIKKYPEINPVCEAVICRFLEDLSILYNKRISPEKQIDFDSEYKKFLRNQHDNGGKK